MSEVGGGGEEAGGEAGEEAGEDDLDLESFGKKKRKKKAVALVEEALSNLSLADSEELAANFAELKKKKKKKKDLEELVAELDGEHEDKENDGKPKAPLPFTLSRF